MTDNQDERIRKLRHDLSNPLAAILAETQLLLLGEDSLDKLGQRDGPAAILGLGLLFDHVANHRGDERYRRGNLDDQCQDVEKTGAGTAGPRTEGPANLITVFSFVGS